MITWDAGARILGNISGEGDLATGDLALSGDIRLSFSVPRGVSGVVAGFTVTENPTLPAHISAGIYVSAGRYRVMEFGAMETEWVSFSEDEPRFQVVRTGSVVTYLFQGLVIHTSSVIPSYTELGAGAVLLSAGDMIVNAQFSGVVSATASLEFRPMVVAASAALVRPAQCSVSFEPLTVRARVVSPVTAELQLLPMQVSSEQLVVGINYAAVSFEPMRINAISTPNVRVYGASVSFEPLEVLAAGDIATETSVGISFLPLVAQGAADAMPAQASLSMRAMQVFAYGIVEVTNPTFSIFLAPVTHYEDMASYGFGQAFATSEVSMLSSDLYESLALASSEVRIDLSESRTSRATAKSQLLHGFSYTAESTASAVASIADVSISGPVVSNATAFIEVGALSLTGRNAASIATASSAVSFFTDDSVESLALATGEYIGQTAQLIESSAEALTETDQVVLANADDAVSTASASIETSDLRQSNQEVLSTAMAYGEVLQYEPSAIAWVVNTQTGAASWYSNYQFVGMIQVGDKVLAVGPEGISTLGGGTDSGLPIEANIDFGFKEYGVVDKHSDGRSDKIKRVTSYWFGYRANTRLAISVETYGQGLPVYTYSMPDVPADSPRNNRIRVGKKLAARYWRISVSNTDGGYFRVNDMSVDVYETSRRI